MRATTRPVLLKDTDDGFPMTHSYVRRFWVAALGPGAVTDLLRLAAAAQGGRSLPTPIHLSSLLVHGLAVRVGTTIGVRQTVPKLPPTLRARLSPSLRRRMLAEERTAA